MGSSSLTEGVEVNDKLERAEKMLRDAEVVTRDGLPTKEPEPASTSRVLGLQLYKADELTRVPPRLGETIQGPLMMLMSLVPVASVSLVLLAFRSSSSPVPRRSIRVTISFTTPARTLTNQMIQ